MLWKKGDFMKICIKLLKLELFRWIFIIFCTLFLLLSEEPGLALACALATSMLPFPIDGFLPRHLRFNHLISQEVSILLRHRGDLLIGGQRTNDTTKGWNLPSLEHHPAHLNLTPLTRGAWHLADSAVPVSNLMMLFPRKFTGFDKVIYTCCTNSQGTGKTLKVLMRGSMDR